LAIHDESSPSRAYKISLRRGGKLHLSCDVRDTGTARRVHRSNEWQKLMAVASQESVAASVYSRCESVRELLRDTPPTPFARLIQLKARKSRAVNEGLNDTGVQTTC
jgi:hypothetical protein